jgi:hypothetical protein
LIPNGLREIVAMILGQSFWPWANDSYDYGCIIVIDFKGLRQTAWPVSISMRELQVKLLAKFLSHLVLEIK